MDRQKGAFAKSSGAPSVPAIERRTARRYNMALRLHYTLQTAAGDVYIGQGVTLNISSGGVLFRPEEGAIPAGFMHIAISWPVLSSGKSMKLCFAGQAVRADEAGIAVQALRHELTAADRGRLAEKLMRMGRTRAGRSAAD
jgi:hypothetical protein